ncbi:hypothetical protein E2C01_013549 [Portunus trituberculatus]|uniref:Uncharacterized protein n=1 Tax=Portunus trituberculatus TaxID=210409 RepID=A0A5B7DHK6_PORTR|nr:hypothetical protein [Portunus trituberculatus]
MMIHHLGCRSGEGHGWGTAGGGSLEPCSADSPEKQFLNWFRGLMNTRVSERPARLVFIKHCAGGSETLVFGIHQPRSTNPTWSRLRNRFRWFRRPKKPVP